jgi:hypothetical protein
MSSKKQFEYIENKIKEAAENSQPAFEEKAWKAMESLLDKDPKKRRPLFWLWFVLPLTLAGGLGLYVLLNHSSETDPSIAENPQSSSIKNSVEKNTGTDKPIIINKDNGEIKNEVDLKNSKTAKKPVLALSRLKSKSSLKLNIQNSLVQDDVISPIAEKSSLTNTSTTTTIITSPTQHDASKDVSIITKPNENINDKVVADAKENNVVKQEKKTKDKKTGNKKGFYLFASAGPDAGAVKPFSFNNSTVTAKYGLGVGYQVNNKWSVQTGLYASQKKYIAGAGDYHPKAGSYWNVVQIKKIDASCLVYEIPLSVRYNFKQTRSASFYAGVGLSSYIMKKEDYNYYYIRDNVYHEAYWEYTGNKHFFSALTFSAGIEKNISSKISVIAEPSVTLPLSGVGDGRVKLFSTTLQAGLKYRLAKNH